MCNDYGNPIPYSDYLVAFIPTVPAKWPNPAPNLCGLPMGSTARVSFHCAAVRFCADDAGSITGMLHRLLLVDHDQDFGCYGFPPLCSPVDGSRVLG